MRAAKYPTETAEWLALSPEASDFVHQLLCAKVEDRLSSWEGLAHSWLGGRLRSVQSMDELSAAQSARQRRKDSVLPSTNLWGLEGVAVAAATNGQVPSVSGEGAEPLQLSAAQIQISQPRRKLSALHSADDLAQATEEERSGEMTEVVVNGGTGPNERHTAVARYDSSGSWNGERDSISLSDDAHL